MNGDFTRFSHDPTKHYTRVLRQQGRVDLDADWNEAMDLQEHHLRTRTFDLVGPSGVPAADPGFGVTYTTTKGVPDLKLSRGRLYVDGLLAALESDSTYLTQPDLKPVPPLAPEAGKRHLVYALLWERHVTAHVDGGLREPALDGLDTATRTRTMAQVHWMDAPFCDTPSALWDEAAEEPRTGLSCRGQPAQEAQDPCDVQPRRGFHGMENRLYRAEVHDAGFPYPFPHDKVASVAIAATGAANTYQVPPIDGQPWQRGDAIELYKQGTATSVLAYVKAVDGAKLTVTPNIDQVVDRARRVATWKWSRDNGSVVLAVTRFAGPRKVEVARFGRDHVLGLRPGDWVELVTEETELSRRPGPFAQVKDIREGDLLVELDRDVAPGTNARLRRWDDPKGRRAVELDAFLTLEDGAQVRFSQPQDSDVKGKAMRPGDWWAFTARHSGLPGDPGTVQDLLGAPPQGRPRLARLAIVEWKKDGTGAWAPSIHDCRRRFVPLTELERPCPATSVGDGTTSVGRHTHNPDYPDGLQQAIDSLATGVLHVLPGRYVLADTLRLHSGITLHGCGDRSVLVAPAGKPAVTTVPAQAGPAVVEVALEALRIEAATPLGAIRLERTEQARIQGCTITHTAAAAASPGAGLVARDARQVRVLDCRIDGQPALWLQAEGATVASSRVRGPVRVARGAHRVELARNVLGHADGAGVEVGGAPPAPADGLQALPDEPPAEVRVEGNVVHGTGQAAIRALAGGGRDLALLGNRVRQCWTDGAPAGAAAVLVEGWSRVQAEGNEVTDNGRTAPGDGCAGLRLVGCADVDLVGNHVAKNGAQGQAPALHLESCDRVHAAHNHLHGWGRIAGKPAAAPARLAVHLHGSAVRLHGNRVRGGAVQVRAAASGVQVEANHVADADAPGIHLGDGTPGGADVLEGVAVRHNHVAAMRGNGIEAVAASVSLVVEGNHVQGCAREDHGDVPPAGIAVLHAAAPRIVGNVVAQSGAGLGSVRRAGLAIAASEHVRAEGNDVTDAHVALRATEVHGLAVTGGRLVAQAPSKGFDLKASGPMLQGAATATAIALRATDVRVSGVQAEGRIHVREGCVRVALEGNRVRGHVLVGGQEPGDDAKAQAVGVHDVRVAGNEVHGAPLAGIATVPLTYEPATGGAHGLAIEDNLVTGCAAGALHLAGVAGARVHGNRIHGNGGDAAILAEACMALDLQRNEVAHGGKGAIVALGCMPAPLAAGDAGPALTLRGNTVLAESGPALRATGMGIASVHGNHFTSLATQEGSTAAATCVDLAFPGNDPLLGLWLPAGLPGQPMAVHHHIDHPFGATAPLASSKGLPSGEPRGAGRVQFQENTVTQHATGTTPATVCILAGSDAAVQGNQVTTRNPGGHVQAALLVHAPRPRVTGNAIEELPGGGAWSSFTVAHRPIVAHNHATHCIHPAPGAAAGNVVELQALCAAKANDAAHPTWLPLVESRLHASWRAIAGQMLAFALEHGRRLDWALQHLQAAGQGWDEGLQAPLAARKAGLDPFVAALRVHVDRCRWMAEAATGHAEGWAIVGRVRLAKAAPGPLRIRLMRLGDGGKRTETGYEATLDQHGDFHMRPSGVAGATYALQLQRGDGRPLHDGHAVLEPGPARRDVVEMDVP